MKLFVGLGNPGDEYAGNRHNVGFMAADRIAQAHRFGPWKRKFQGHAADGEIAGAKVLLLKPDTFMNESGRAVGEAARFLKIAEADIVVFYDEIDLPPGKLKVKTGGGNAGHNGLRSMSAHIGNDYVRVRIGVGHPGSREAVARWVLSDFAKVEREWLVPLLDAIAAACPRLVVDDQSRFQSDVGKMLGEAPDPRKEPEAKTKAGRSDQGVDTQESERKAGTPGRHPLSERASKRENAIADNLRKWLEAKKPKT